MRGKHNARPRCGRCCSRRILIRAQTQRCCVRVVRFSYKRLYGSSDKVATMAKGRGRKPRRPTPRTPARPTIDHHAQTTHHPRADLGRQVASVVRCLDATNPGDVTDLPVLLDHADPGAGRGVVGILPRDEAVPSMSTISLEVSDPAIRGPCGGTQRRFSPTISRIYVTVTHSSPDPVSGPALGSR
jgi:hypothetical protein